MNPCKKPYHWHFHDQRPRWLPEDYPWPPKKPRGRRFFRRIGCAFILFNLFTVTVFAVILIFLLRALGAVDFPFDAQQWLPPLGIAVLMLFMVGFGLTNLGRRISAPLDEMLSAAERISEGDYAVRVKEQGPREVRSLAQAFNHMAERLNRSNKQRREMLSDVTHELRTPLTVLIGNLEGMLDGVYPADEANLRSLLDETHILQRLVDDLRMLALAESGAILLRKEATDLGVLVSDTLASFQSQAEAANVSLLQQHDETLPLLEIDPGRMRQVLFNLLVNALRYTPAGGEIIVRTRREGTKTVIEVQDNGAGISESDLPHIFERFYKSTDSGGMGLGLAIARHLVEAHGGKIEAESAPGKGTTMRISLP